MIPLGDADRRPLHVPLITGTLIALNLAAYLLELAGGDAFITRWSVIPADIMAGHNWITILTSTFLHAGVVHILGNMIFFWAFGPEIEDVMGGMRYLAFYLIGAVVAGAAEVLVDPTSTIPNLGASGAIAAVMGAFLITYPRDRIRTVLLFGWFARITFVPAIILVGVWFLTQVFSEIGAQAAVESGGVAYMAHVGGFIFGAIFGRFFETRERRESEGLA